MLLKIGPDPQPVPLAGGKRAGCRHPAPARPGVAILSSAQKVISSSSVRDCGATPARRVRPLVRLQLVMSTRASSSSSSACRTAGLKNLRAAYAPESLALRRPETTVSRIPHPPSREADKTSDCQSHGVPDPAVNHETGSDPDFTCSAKNAGRNADFGPCRIFIAYRRPVINARHKPRSAAL